MGHTQTRSHAWISAKPGFPLLGQHLYSGEIPRFLRRAARSAIRRPTAGPDRAQLAADSRDRFGRWSPVVACDLVGCALLGRRPWLLSGDREVV